MAVKLVASAADSTVEVVVDNTGVADRAFVAVVTVVILHPIASTDCLVVVAVVAMDLSAENVT